MRELIALTKRNIKMYLRDKTSVFFSFLSVLILVAVYLLFLKNMYGGLQGFTETQLSVFSTGYIMGGVLVVATLTLPLGVIGTYVTDLETKRINGFLVTPVKRHIIILSYYLATVITTLFLVIAMLGLTLAYLGLTTGFWHTPLEMLQLVGVVTAFVFISTPLVVFLVSFIKSSNAFGALSSMVGTLIGFVSGIYIPLFLLDSVTKTIATVLPFSHMAILLRRMLIGKDIIHLLPADALNELGISYLNVFGLQVNSYVLFGIFFLLSLGLIAIAYLKMNKKAKK